MLSAAWLPRGVIGLMIASASVLAQSIDLVQEYCSNQNTGYYYTPVFNHYNSNGACQTLCQDDYAFAVVQYEQCWCSNYIPENQLSVSDCSQPCPGYPSEYCGNEGQGYYGYILLSKTPIGTAGGYTPSATASSTPASTEQTTTETVAETTTTVAETTSYVSQTVSVVHTVTPSPVTSVEVVTISGADVTQTVTSTPMVVTGGGSTTPIQEEHQSGLSGGAIAGVVIGVVIALAALAIGALLLLRRRRRDDDEGGTEARNSPRRNVSVLSKTGLLSRARPASVNEKDHDDPPPQLPPTGNNSTRHSMMFGGLGDGVSPVSPLGSSHDGGSSRRHSKPFVYDQRLNPSALWANHDNSSRVSMQDNNDYSRPLGVANPDPRASFESRISRL